MNGSAGVLKMLPHRFGRVATDLLHAPVSFCWSSSRSSHQLHLFCVQSVCSDAHLWPGAVRATRVEGKLPSRTLVVPISACLRFVLTGVHFNTQTSFPLRLSTVLLFNNTIFSSSSAGASPGTLGSVEYWVSLAFHFLII